MIRIKIIEELMKVFSPIICLFFFLTGLFALISSLFTWGKGWLFNPHPIEDLLLPYADLIITVPFSWITAFGLRRKQSWGVFMGLTTCGIYLFGSALVYIQLFWKGPPYPIALILPPIVGIVFSIFYIQMCLTFRVEKPS